MFSVLSRGGPTLSGTDTQDTDESEQTLNTGNEIAGIPLATGRWFLVLLG